MFQELKNQGTLNQYVLDKQHKINDRLTALEHQGLQPHEADELLRDQIYPPSETDAPNLVEKIHPYTD